MISVQCGKLLAIVPGKGIPGVAVVVTHSQPVEVVLRLDTKAGVFCVGLASGPVFQSDQQLVIVLVGQPVDVL